MPPCFAGIACALTRSSHVTLRLLLRLLHAETPEKLPSLPPQWHRANMSASQRLRLHLWLLHCAARNSSITQGLGRGQVRGSTEHQQGHC
jgi:hypothetical protein